MIFSKENCGNWDLTPSGKPGGDDHSHTRNSQETGERTGGDAAILNRAVKCAHDIGLKW